MDRGRKRREGGREVVEMEGSKRRMEGKKEGLVHITPPLVPVLLQRLPCRRRSIFLERQDHPPQGSLGGPAAEAELSAEESGQSGADGSRDQLLSFQTRVRKEGFRDRDSRTPSALCLEKGAANRRHVWSCLNITPQSSRAKASEPALLGSGLSSVWRGTQRGARASSPRDTTWGYITLSERLGAPPSSVLNILSRPARDKDPAQKTVAPLNGLGSSIPKH